MCRLHTVVWAERIEFGGGDIVVRFGRLVAFVLVGRPLLVCEVIGGHLAGHPLSS